MISSKGRDIRRGKGLKMSKNIERLYKEGKCRECSVVVTRMDFAKILGKFTKVKIQYESSSTPKTKKELKTSSPNSRLKSNENGMVLLHRNAYNEHPVKDLLNSKKPKNTYVSTPRQASNILKENNRLKKTPVFKDKNSNYNDKSITSGLKQYGIVFVDPTEKNNNDTKSKITLSDLLPVINKDILPSEEWCIDYFPKNDEPKDDKVYDRIAAELEDLMYSEKTNTKANNKTENKVDDFPSIMDILNDNSSNNTTKNNDQNSSIEYKSNLESSDVEAMLLGKSEPTNKILESTPMEVDSTDMSNFIDDVGHLNAQQGIENNQECDIKIQDQNMSDIDNPHSPSILDEALQKGIEEQLPIIDPKNDVCSVSNENIDKDADKRFSQKDSEDSIDNSELKIENVTHVIFKKTLDGNCYKTVTCPKTLKYSIELNGKSVEFLGAPKYISSLEDLQVLLQIVDESDLESLYVLY